MPLNDLHPYNFIQLYGYHSNHAKQEPEPECLGDRLSTSFEECFKTNDKFCKSCGEPLKQRDQLKYSDRTSAENIW
jgi:hypothetical protein